MKGPGLRTDLDVRRVWSCPKCGRITRTAGRVTAQRCPCANDGQWMQLQPPVKREPFRPPPREPDEPTAGELAEEVLEDDGNPVAEAPREAAAVLAETVVEPAAAIEVSTTIEVQVVAVNETPAISPAPPAAEPSGVPETTGIPESTGTPDAGPDDPFGAGITDSPAAT